MLSPRLQYVMQQERPLSALQAADVAEQHSRERNRRKLLGADSGAAVDILSAQLATIGQPGQTPAAGIAQAVERAQKRRAMNRQDMMRMKIQQETQEAINQRFQQTQSGIQERFETSQAGIEERHEQRMSGILTPEQKTTQAVERKKALLELEKDYKEPPEERATRIQNETKIREETRDAVIKRRETRNIESRKAFQEWKDDRAQKGQKLKDEAEGEQTFRKRWNEDLDQAKQHLSVAATFSSPGGIRADTDADKRKIGISLREISLKTLGYTVEEYEADESVKAEVTKYMKSLYNGLGLE